MENQNGDIEKGKNIPTITSNIDETILIKMNQKKFDTLGSSNKNIILNSSTTTNKNLDLSTLSKSKGKNNNYLKIPQIKYNQFKKLCMGCKNKKSLSVKDQNRTIDPNDNSQLLNSLLLEISNHTVEKETHKPKLCYKPERIYIKELLVKKKQFEIYKAQSIKEDKMSKKKQREYINEKSKQWGKKIDIEAQLKQSKLKMLNFIQKSKSPYSNRWTSFMLEKNYNCQMIISGFLNGVPKYDIIRKQKKKNVIQEYHSNLNELNQLKLSTIMPSPKRELRGSLSQRNIKEKTISFPKIYHFFDS